MTQDLVPTGQPYGARKATVDASRRAGLSLESSPQQTPRLPAGGSELPAGPIRRVRPNLDLLAGNTPDQFPQPNAPAAPVLARHPSAGAYFNEVATNAGSQFVRAVAARYAARG